MHKRDKGYLAEDIAEQVLESMCMRVLERNFYCKFGEIDIIAQNSADWLVFVEVKSNKYGSAVSILQTLRHQKLARIKRSILFWLTSNHRHGSKWRLDFIGLTKKQNMYCIHHIPNL